jgi:predicted glycosyltransferase
MKGLLKFIYSTFGGTIPLKQQSVILKEDKQVVAVLVDILYNILHKNVVPASEIVINKLSKYKKQIYKLIAKTTSHKARVNILLQNREIIRIILPLIPSISANLDNEPLYQDVFNKRK